MATANGFSEAASAIRSVDILPPSFTYSFTAIIPGDSLWHTLNEDGLGYFPLGSNPFFEGDRAIRSIEFTNRDAVLSVEMGSFDHKIFQSPAPLGAFLMPGETRIRTLSKLSSIAFRNLAAVPVLLSVSFVAEDR